MSCARHIGYFRRLIDTHHLPSLSVLAEKNNQIVCDFFESSKRAKSLSPGISRKTRFNIGSVTKPITGSLFIKLTEMGGPSFFDPVKKFIPEFRFDNITINHLLTHTAGFSGAIKIPWPKEPAERQFYFDQIYAIDKLHYPAGEQSEYFTYGYSIVSDIIERVAQTTIEAFARKYLFDPLEMAGTTYEVSGLNSGEFVLPYNPAENNSGTLSYNAPPTGDSGLFSHAADLLKFCRMILNRGVYNGQRIFAETSIDHMLSEATDNKFMRTSIFWLKGPNDCHGCFGDLCSETTVGHPGFTGSMLFIDQANRTAGVILSNSTAFHEDWRNYKEISNVIAAF